MPFVSGLERIAEEAGRQKGLEEGINRGEHIGLLEGLEYALEARFQATGIALFSEIKETADLATLRALNRAIHGAASVEELREYLFANPYPEVIVLA